MIAFTSVLNMALRFGESLRHVFLKACKVTFKVLTLPLFLKLLMNLKPGDNNRKRASNLLRPVDILSLREWEMVDRVRETCNSDSIITTHCREKKMLSYYDNQIQDSEILRKET